MVYVDAAAHPYGRMVMCHMLADTSAELLAMADAIGVQRKWLQGAGTWREHFDICRYKRKQALANGAQAITRRELVEMLKARQSSLCPHEPQPTTERT